MNFLAERAAAARQRVRQARAARGEAALLAECRDAPAPPPLSLAEFGVIAEVKRQSPAEGALSPAADAATLARCYADGGAAAISVLTEPERFGGSLDDLGRAACAAWPAGVPAMRKDFLVDTWQVLEARAAGAGGVLVILAMLDDAAVRELLAAAREQGLFVLLEAFDEADLERAARLATDGPEAPLLVGVNTRDLKTLQVDPQRLAALAPRLPVGLPAVAESGIRTPDDAAAAARLGYRLALVGTALMRSAAPAELARAMRDAGRAAA
jgi:indole-3-glycerol phosphate synthase